MPLFRCFVRRQGKVRVGMSGRKHIPVQGIRKARRVLGVSMLRAPGFETGQDKWKRETEAGS